MLVLGQSLIDQTATNAKFTIIEARALEYQANGRGIKFRSSQRSFTDKY